MEPVRSESSLVLLYEAIQAFHKELATMKTEILQSLKDYTPRAEYNQQVVNIQSHIGTIEELAKQIGNQCFDIQKGLEKNNREIFERIGNVEHDLQVQILKMQTEAANARAELETRFGVILIKISESASSSKQQVSEQQNFLDNRLLQWVVQAALVIGSYLIGHLLH